MASKQLPARSANSNSNTPLFELSGVSQRFGQVAALADINLRIRPGERVALVGPSGAGKSTLIRLLNGTLLPSTGTVRVLGQDLAALSAVDLRGVQRQIGTVYQQFHLVGGLSVVHNVNAGHLGRWPVWQAAWSLARPQDVERAAAALDRVGIPEKLYERTERLSGGQQQRVAIARVLVQDPAAILADEPIASLDPERGREIMDLLRDLSQTTGKTLVTSVHLVEYARTHFERVIGLRHGRLLFDAPAGDLSPAVIEDLYRIT